MSRNDLTGQRFGKYVVIALSEPYKGRKDTWLCKCDCGNERIVYGFGLRNGRSTNCGCVRTKHGMSQSKLYRVYYLMCQRCHATYNKRYFDYGGRGIKVCEEWRNSFIVFSEWALQKGYQEGLTIDRINNNGNYCPENCRWVDRKTQQNNRRDNHLIEYRSETHTIAEWGDILNISPSLICDRLRRGWDVSRVFDPIKKPKNLTINGITKTQSEWANENGIKLQTLIRRIENGWGEEELLKPINPSYSRTQKRKTKNKTEDSVFCQYAADGVPWEGEEVCD